MEDYMEDYMEDHMEDYMKDHREDYIRRVLIGGGSYAAGGHPFVPLFHQKIFHLLALLSFR